MNKLLDTSSTPLSRPNKADSGSNRIKQTHIRDFVSDPFLDPPNGSEDRPEQSFPSAEAKDLVEQPDGQEDERAVEDGQVRIHRFEGSPEIAFREIAGTDVGIFWREEVVDAELADPEISCLADNVAGISERESLTLVAAALWLSR